MRVIFCFTLLLTAALAGCTDDDTVRITFVAKDTQLAPSAGLDDLADALSTATGHPVEITFSDSNTVALAALHGGQADLASVDGAAGWLAWKTLGLEAIGAETRSDGRTHYIAAAWVRNGSDIQTVDDLAGVDSCHTGATKSAGMLMPMSYLAANGHIDATAYPDDISQVQEMARDFFGEATIGGAYDGYEGALRCLSDGTGDVAFIRDSTPNDYCDADGAADRDWCLDLEDYRLLVEFGPVPEHPIMVSPFLDGTVREDVAAALFALGDSNEGSAILRAVFGTSAIVPVSTEEHLGAFGDLVAHLPGIEAYAEAK